jgi:hypothetical protein
VALDLLAIGTCLAGLGAIIAVIFAFSVWRNTRHNLFVSLWQEYKTPEMLESLQMFYELWDECEGDPQEIADKYVECYGGPTGGRLHEARRMVSHFFQRLALLDSTRLIPRRFRREWYGVSLDVIAVLHPIETNAMKRLVSEKVLPSEFHLENLSADFTRLFGMYNKWRRWIKKTKKCPVIFRHCVNIFY